MALSEEMNQTIDRLIELAEQENDQTDFSVGDMVNFTDEGGDLTGQVEAVEGELATVRVMAMAGDDMEPTDRIETIAMSELSPLNEQPEPKEGEEEEEPEDDPETGEDEDIEKNAFVSWQSKDGQVKGKVISLHTEAVTIPETGDTYEASEKSPVALVEVYRKHEGAHEDTGVHVALKPNDLTVIDKPLLKAHKLFVKVKTYETGEDDDEKSGWFDGLASAYGEVDLGGDTVAKGAYNQTLNHNDGKFNLMFDHGWGVDKVAGVAFAEDTDEGLRVKGEMPIHITSVRDVHEKIKFMNSRGKPLGLSIGYWPVKTEPGPKGTRILKEIALEEVSITPFPMDTHARIRDAKSRKFLYHMKRNRWQNVNKPDAPSGNQHPQDEYSSLVGELKHTLNQIK